MKPRFGQVSLAGNLDSLSSWNSFSSPAGTRGSVALPGPAVGRGSLGCVGSGTRRRVALDYSGCGAFAGRRCAGPATCIRRAAHSFGHPPAGQPPRVDSAPG